MSKCRLSELEKHFAGPIDVFICSASFEPRSRSIADHLHPDDVGQSWIAYNANFDSVVGDSREYLSARFGERTVVLQLDTDDPIATADTFVTAFSRLHKGQPNRFFVDITTFTRESLLILLQVLRAHVTVSDEVWFGYNGAAKYSIDREEGDEWLSLGVRDIRSVLGYPGALLPSRPSHLIVMVGFEIERAASLIEKYEPAVLTLGYGSQERSIKGPHHDTNRRFHDKLAAFYVNVRRFEFAPDDAMLTQASIEAQVEQVADHNVVVAPMNTKISTIGAALAAMRNEEIQICYAQAQLYNVDAYAAPEDDCYVFQLPGFGVS